MFSKITLLKVGCLAISVLMTAVTIYASLQQNLMTVLPRMIHDPWTAATFIDFYNNILLISAWMAYKENHAGKTIAWFVAFVLGGSITTSLYVFLQLNKLRPEDSLDRVLVRGS